MTVSNFRSVMPSVFSLMLCTTASVGHAGIADEAPTFRGPGDDRRFELEHDSLIISSSTYDRHKGALATLSIGTTLPDSATATTLAVASNNYVTVWNNATDRKSVV